MSFEEIAVAVHVFFLSLMLMLSMDIFFQSRRLSRIRRMKGMRTCRISAKVKKAKCWIIAVHVDDDGLSCVDSTLEEERASVFTREEGYRIADILIKELGATDVRLYPADKN